MKFRKKPAVVEAVRIGTGMLMPPWLSGAARRGDCSFLSTSVGELAVTIQTLEGLMIGNTGDWIIRGVKGELYPCRDDIFRETYEPVEEGES